MLKMANKPVECKNEGRQMNEENAKQAEKAIQSVSALREKNEGTTRDEKVKRAKSLDFLFGMQWLKNKDAFTFPQRNRTPSEVQPRLSEQQCPYQKKKLNEYSSYDRRKHGNEVDYFQLGKARAQARAREKADIMETIAAEKKEIALDISSNTTSKFAESKNSPSNRFSPDKTAELTRDDDKEFENPSSSAHRVRFAPNVNTMGYPVGNSRFCQGAVGQSEFQSDPAAQLPKKDVRDPFDFIVEDKGNDPNLLSMAPLTLKSNAAMNPPSQSYSYQYNPDVPSLCPSYRLSPSSTAAASVGGNILPQDSDVTPVERRPYSPVQQYQQLQEAVPIKRAPAAQTNQPGLQSGNISSLDPRLLKFSVVLNQYILSHLEGNSSAGNITFEDLAAAMQMPRILDGGLKQILPPSPPQLPQRDFKPSNAPQLPGNTHQSPPGFHQPPNYDYSSRRTSSAAYSGSTQTHPQQSGPRSPNNFIRAPLAKGRGQIQSLN